MNHEAGEGKEKIEQATIKVSELAIMLGINKNTAYEYLENGTIPAQRLGRKWLISKEQVLAWLNSGPSLPITQRKGRR